MVTIDKMAYRTKEAALFSLDEASGDLTMYVSSACIGILLGSGQRTSSPGQAPPRTLAKTIISRGVSLDMQKLSRHGRNAIRRITMSGPTSALLGALKVLTKVMRTPEFTALQEYVEVSLEGVNPLQEANGMPLSQDRKRALIDFTAVEALTLVNLSRGEQLW